jgi:photosystem II stability/assembly factor-like uncharacterized protein
MKNAAVRFLKLCALFLCCISFPLSAAWVNATGNLANMASECGNLIMIGSVHGKDKVIAGVAQKGLWSTADGGTTWTRMGTGSGSATITNRVSWFVYDPINADIFWEAGIYNGGGEYKTTDGGLTFTQLGSVVHSDCIAVDLSDPQRKTLLASGHEQSQKLSKSTDGGSTWTSIGGNLPGGTGYSSYPYVINSTTYLIGIQSSGGIYRSIDAGGSWTKVCASVPSSGIIRSSSGEFYCGGQGGLLLKGSGDGTTWTSLNCGAKLVAPIELPGGKIASISANGIIISADKGATWKTAAKPLPTLSTWHMDGGLVYDDVRGAFVAWFWDCGSVVRADAIWRYDTLISGGTGISPPRTIRLPVSSLKDVAMFDIAGRSIIGHGFSKHPATAYISRMSDGVVVKRILQY